MVRVLMISPQFPPDIRGGRGRQVGDLVRHLSGTVEFGLIAPSTAPDDLAVDSYPFEPYGDMLPQAGIDPLLRMNLAVQSAASDARAAGNWDLIHAHDWAIAPAVSQLAQSTGIPMIATVHANNGGNLGGSGNEPVRRLAWEESLMEASTVVTAVSEPLAQTLRDRYPNAEVRTIPNGIELPATPVDRSAGNPYEILYVGRLVPYKGVQDLLSAMPRVLESVPEARLRIAGEGFYRQELESLTRRLELDDHVEFAGWLDGADLASAHRRAAVMVAPSHEEAFGLVVGEAMAAGVPVVASDCPAFQALVADTITGRLFQTGDAQDLAHALTESLQNPEIGKAMAIDARKGIEQQNTWELIGNRYLDLYREVAR